MTVNRVRLGLVVLGVVAGVMAVAPGAAGAAPPTSAVEVSPTSVAPGGIVTVTQTLHNPEQFTVTGAKAALYATPAIDGVLDLVSCTGTIAPCGALGASYRGPVGDLPGGETRTVVFTFQVRGTAAPGPLALSHQFVGDNYGFETLDGPTITITPVGTDLGVTLTGRARLLGGVEYTVVVHNGGPAAATGIRVAATLAPGLVFAGSADCARVGQTRVVNCDIATLAVGASARARFVAVPGVLLIGPFTTSARLQSSTPADLNPSNNTATETCSALTGLLVRC